MTALLQRGVSCTKHVLLHINDYGDAKAVDHLLLQQAARGLPVTR